MSQLYLGDVSSDLIIHTDDHPKQFVYSVDSWLLEMNSIELKESSSDVNSTRIEWTVYTRRRSILFQVRIVILFRSQMYLSLCRLLVLVFTVAFCEFLQKSNCS